jgi:serine/threonine-protein kinase
MLRFGPYEVHEELGRGGMGIVYRGFDPLIQRDVALKTIKLYDISDEAERRHMQDRLAREAQSAGRLSHPNIVTIYQVGYAEMRPNEVVAYIAMEYVPGRTLAAILEKARPGNHTLVLKLLRQAAEGLDYAHSQGVIHRDVKPANLLITSEGRLKITDFGVAKLVSHTMTMTGTVLGSPFYMSPEQIRADRVDGRSDQYALAVVAYEVFGGRKPFQAETLSALVYKIAHEEAPGLELDSAALAGRLTPILKRAMAKDPEARYPNCLALVDALEHAWAEPAAVAAPPLAETQPVRPAPPAPPSRPAPVQPPSPKPSPAATKKQPWLAIAAGVAVVAIILAGATQFFKPGLPAPASSAQATPAEPEPEPRTSNPPVTARVTSTPMTPTSTAPIKPSPAPPPAPRPAAKPDTTPVRPQPLVSAPPAASQTPPIEPPAKPEAESPALDPKPAAAQPPPPTPSKEILRTPPRLLQRAPAAYTNDARNAGIEGTVQLSVDIDERGIPVRARILKSLHPGLDQNAIRSLGGWRFQPATEDGRPAPSTATIDINFSLVGAPSRQAPSLKKLKP